MKPPGKITTVLLCCVFLAQAASAQTRQRPLSKEEQLRRDQKKTVQQGQGLGAVGGALVGGLLGGLLGAATGDKKAVAAGVAAGMAAGGTMGYHAGGQKGRQVAAKKLAYARREENYDRRISGARAQRIAAQRQNAALRSRIAQLSQRSQVLQAQVRQGKASKAEVAVYKREVGRQQAAAQSSIQSVSLQIASQQQAVSAARRSGSSGSGVRQWDAELRAMEAERSKLIQQNRQLQQINNRVGI